MKVLHVNDECNVSFNLAAGLRELGHTAEVWCESRPDARLPVPAKIAYLPVRIATFARLNRRIRSEHFDIVQIHNADRGWIGILGRYPYFLHCHGSDVRIGLTDPVRRMWTVPALRRAHRVVVTTPDLLGWLREIRPDAVFLPNPLRTELFAPTSSMNRSGVRVLLFSAFDDALKGSGIAVEALRHLHSSHPEVQICAFALGPDLARFRSIPWIEFIAPVAASDVSAQLNDFDVIVGQFSFGQLGVSELESMSMAKPVVCYVNDEFSAAYSTAPPVMSAKEPREIAAALGRLISNAPMRRDLGARAREWVVRHHDYLSVSRRLMDLYVAAGSAGLVGGGRPVIVIIDYGVGNLGSVANMLKKIKVEAVVSGEAAVIERATKLILPGVGSFDGAMRHLQACDLIPTLHRRVLDERVPILGLCVGMQMFSRGSEEGRLPGLGWIDAQTVRFQLDPERRDLKVPHMGWSEVERRQDHAIWRHLDGTEPRFYFVHSFHLACDKPETVLATAWHGYDFAAAVVRDNIFGTQWHPEKSHSYGMKFLRGFADL